MPRSKKQKVEANESDEEERASSGDEGSDSSLSMEMIQADFEAFAPTEKDFGGIRSLLQQLLLKAPVNLNDLSELIIQQSDIGCVHKVASGDEPKQEEGMETDEDVYGIVTLVDVTTDDKECIRQLKTFLQKRYAEVSSKSPLPEKSKSMFSQLWKPEKEKRVGWIINERLVNIPYHIAVPSFQSLLEELDASESKFDKFFAILKVHKLNTASEAGAGASTSGGNVGRKGSKASKKQNKKGAQAADMVIFSNSEEELLSEECDCAFDYSVANETEGAILGERRADDGFYKPFRRVVVFDRAVFDRFLTKLVSIGNA